MFDHLSFKDILLLSFPVIFLSLSLWFAYGHQNPKQISIPPGPWGLPMLGSLINVRKNPVQVINQWARQYGSCYSLQLGNQLVIVLSDNEVVRELLVNRGALSASRKEYFIGGQTAMSGRGVIATPQSELWRDHRRLMQLSLNPQQVHDCIPRIQLGVKQLLCRLEERSNSNVNHETILDDCVLDTMLAIMLGSWQHNVDVASKRDILAIVQELKYLLNPVSHLADFIPMLRYLPSRAHNRACKTRDLMIACFVDTLRDIRSQMRLDQDVPDCFGKEIVSHKEDGGIGDVDAGMLAAGFIIGGQISIPDFLKYFIEVLASRPDVQKCAYGELDHVVGRERMPTVEDEHRMPYCRAMIKELERCKPPAVDSPHVVTEDFQYKNMLIPKGSALILNYAALNNDGDRFPQAEKFEPKRHLKEFAECVKSAVLVGPNHHDSWIFGTGRRICPAVLLADRIIWLNISALLWTFTFEVEVQSSATGIAKDKSSIRFIRRQKNT